MLFKVIHIDFLGHRHRARVSARNVWDVIDQANRQWGDARRLACTRVPAKAPLSFGPHGGKPLEGELP